MAEQSAGYDDLITHLWDVLGDGLRAVDAYDRETIENCYIRDDVAERYTDQEWEKMRSERVLEGFSARHAERVYHIGDFRFGLRRFEEAMLLYVPLEADRGVVVSVDADAELSFPSFGDDVIAHL